MTKLFQWLFGISIFISIWLAFVYEKVSHPLLAKHETLVLYFPIIAGISFGICLLIIVLWRVYNFNDCQEAAEELKLEIEEAKKDLTKKGFRFTEDAR